MPAAPARLLLLTFLTLVGSSDLVHAQTVASRESPAPTIIVASSHPVLRFSSPTSVCQMRVEILAPTGETLYDSSWRDGNVLDWTFDTADQPLTSGSYRCRVTVRDLNGEVSEHEATLIASGGEILLDPRSGGLTMIGPDRIPKVTLMAHDGENGSVVTTSGDLLFRFGNFLAGKDREQMRLSADGELQVEGLIRTGEGIVFPDGTIQTTASAEGTQASILRRRPTPSTPDHGSENTHLQPHANTSGTGTTNQITKWTNGPTGVIGDSAVTEVGGRVGIGNPSPTQALDVAGNIVIPNGSYLGSKLANGTTTAGFYNIDASNNEFMGTTAANNLYLFAGSGFLSLGTSSTMNAVVVANGGNVGIGTTTPASKLDVVGNVNVSGNLVLPASSSSAGAILIAATPFLHGYGTRNTFVGTNAGNFTTSGFSNTASGYQSLNAVTSGYANTGNGAFSLHANDVGLYNTATGYQALYSTGGGSYNTGFGYGALFGNTTGNYNIAIGWNAGSNLTIGDSNIYIGNNGVTAEGNTIRIGSGSQTRAFVSGIRGVTTGNADAVPVLIDSLGQMGTSGGPTPSSANIPNTLVLRDASGNFSAGTVTLAGNLALPPTTSASAGVITEGGSPFAHSYGMQNTFLGINSGNFTITGNQNVAVGYRTLQATGGGNANTAVGNSALALNVSGSQNTAVGNFALSSNTAGTNTAIGDQALTFNSSGANNVGVGEAAMQHNTTGYSNTAVGASASSSNTIGFNNTALGFDALLNNTTGQNNIAIGESAGAALTTGSYNIDIGNSGAAGETQTIRIGNTLLNTRTFIAGIYGTTIGSTAVPALIDQNGQIGTASSSRRYKYDIADMGSVTDDLMRLRPVTFRYVVHGKNAPIQYGLIAEEVAGVYPELVTHNNDGQVETVMYQFLAPMLLNEVQKQHRTIQDQQKTIEDLSARLDALSKRLEAVESRMIR